MKLCRYRILLCIAVIALFMGELSLFLSGWLSIDGRLMALAFAVTSIVFVCMSGWVIFRHRYPKKGLIITSVLVLLFVVFEPLQNKLTYHVLNSKCCAQIQRIQEVMQSYVKLHGKLPEMARWADILCEHDPKLTKKDFRCPFARLGQVSFVINKNLYAASNIQFDPQQVMILEIAGKWNESGDRSDLSFGNHEFFARVVLANGQLVSIKKTADDNESVQW
jgi:hypothetical protein